MFHVKQFKNTCAMKEIAFVEQDVKVRFLKRTDARESLLKVLKRLKCSSGGITYIFCSDKALLKINSEYLNHDTLTDVITFDYTMPGDSFPMFNSNSLEKGKGRIVSGDIYISIDRIKENAEMFHVKHIDELNRVMIHGILHLAGFKDKTPEEEREIHIKEDEMLKTCFGYVE